MDWISIGNIPPFLRQVRELSPEDKQNFTLLMKELREALNTLEREQTLTFASAGWKPYYDNIETPGSYEACRLYEHVMTYDQVGSSSSITPDIIPRWVLFRRERIFTGTPAWEYMDKAQGRD